ncbi:Hydrogenase formation HypD protein like protein, partial [Aduncisulcus paluster]
MMVRASGQEHPAIQNQYVRGVSENGNPKAVEVMYQVFEESDALWRGCKCGEVLKGKMTPEKCPLFGKACTPAKPVGPCMVSTEGSCAAYFKYKVD